MLRKAGDAPGHKTVVSVLGLLCLALCQNPAGLPSVTLKALALESDRFVIEEFRFNSLVGLLSIT